MLRNSGAVGSFVPLCIAALAMAWSSVSLAAPPADLADPLDTPEGAMAINPAGVPGTSPEFDSEPRPARLGAKIMYINFDGGQMNSCNNNSPLQNCSTIFGGTVLPYSGDVGKRASVVQVLRSRVADFGITVTDQRPASGDYDMEMVGNWEGAEPDFAGIAPGGDCFDQRGGDTSFTLDVAGTSDGVAEIILQEIAHTWGLEHVDEQQDLLFPTTAGQGKTFQDVCHKIVSDTDLNESNGQCNSMHQLFCDFAFQNSYRELLELFGESIPDTTAPSVSFVSPADGDVLDSDDVELVIAFADDQSPQVINMTLRIESDAIDEPFEQDGAYAAPSELTFPVNELGAGEYTISLEARDEADNTVTDSVTFTVTASANGDDGDDGNADAGDGAGDDGADGSGDGGADSAGGDDAGDDDGTGASSSDGAGASSDDEGCACRTSTTLPNGLVWLGALLFAVSRRRRSASAR